MGISQVALCADPISLQHPEAIGLAGENLAAQEWLRLFASAEEARQFLKNDHVVNEVWVASSDDVAPINLAATLKRDRPDRSVCLLSLHETGSLKSRVSATGINASLSSQAFAKRYALHKRRAAVHRANATMEAAIGSTASSAAAPTTSGARASSAMGEGAANGGEARDGVKPTMGGCSTIKGDADGVLPDERSRTATVVCSTIAPSVQGGSAFLLPVVSGSGGAGKSTVATIAALIAQGLGYDTLLLDFDLQFGDLTLMMGTQDSLGMDEVLAAPARLAQLRPEGLRPALLASPKHLEDAESVMECASSLIDQLMERFDVIVANTGAAWAEQHAVLLERSSRALFLVDQRPSSLRACQHALDLCARCGIASGPFLFAVNRCAKGAPLTSIDASCALGGAHVVELRDGGRDVEELMDAGLPLELLESRNDLCTSVERLLLEVLPNADGRAVRGGWDEPRRLGLDLLKGKRARRRKRGALCL